MRRLQRKIFFSALPYGGAHKTTEECSKKHDSSRYLILRSLISGPFATTHTYQEVHRSQQIIVADHVSQQTPIHPLCFYAKQLIHTRHEAGGWKRQVLIRDLCSYQSCMKSCLVALCTVKYL